MNHFQQLITFQLSQERVMLFSHSYLIHMFPSNIISRRHVLILLFSHSSPPHIHSTVTHDDGYGRARVENVIASTCETSMNLHDVESTEICRRR